MKCGEFEPIPVEGDGHFLNSSKMFDQTVAFKFIL